VRSPAAGAAGHQGGASSKCPAIHDEASEWGEYAEEHTAPAGRIISEGIAGMRVH